MARFGEGRAACITGRNAIQQTQGESVMLNQSKPFIHEKAEIQTDSIGEDTKVLQYSII